MTFKHRISHRFGTFLPLILTQFQRNQVVLTRVLTILLLISCAWLLGKMVWLPFSSTTIVPWRAEISELNRVVASKVGIESIKRRELFGAYEKNAKPKVVTPTVKEAPKTKLSLSLVGVVVVEPQELSLAIIANRNSQDTYGIDQKIEGTRATVSAVYKDRVVIDNAGRSETLLLAETSTKRSSNNKVTASRGKDKPNIDYDEDANSTTSVSTGDNIVDLRQQISEKPSQLLQYVRMSKMKRDGNVVGYRLKPRRAPELFKSFGFENGDIATQINGIDLTQDDALSQLNASMNDLTEVSVTVERDGQPYDIYIQL